MTAEITKKLTEISEVMADGFYFIHVRMLAESWEKLANEGNEKAQEVIKMIEAFHRLCHIVKNDS